MLAERHRSAGGVRGRPRQPPGGAAFMMAGDSSGSSETRRGVAEGQLVLPTKDDAAAREAVPGREG